VNNKRKHQGSGICAVKKINPNFTTADTQRDFIVIW
jgi:hypothetical protein